jgi:tripartite ATP-independent transporter DctM subunit
MSPETLTVLMFGSFVLFLVLGVPLAWTTSSVGLIFGFLLYGTNSLNVILFRIWETLNSFSLIAIPLFVFMGNMLQYSGISEGLFKAIYVWLGPIRGGLAAATIILCTILAAMLGTVGADVTITGLMALPFMLQRKYDKFLALGSITAGGALGVLIPPSIMFVVYGVTVGESIGKLLIGGVGPGLLLSGLYILYILTKCYFRPEAGPAAPPEERSLTFVQKLVLLKGLILPILLILGVIGSIFGGVATPGEAAGVGALGAMVCAALRGQLVWKNLKPAIYGTMKTIGVIMWIVFGAVTFIATFNLSGGGDFVKETLIALPLGRWGVIIVIQLILIFLGMFLDVIGITVLCAPIFVPVIKALGFNPLWFGVIFNINLQIAYLSPPFGYSMFYLKAVAPPDITMTDLYRSVWPFICLQVVGMSLCMIFPEIVLWLPNLMIK